MAAIGLANRKDRSRPPTDGRPAAPTGRAFGPLAELELGVPRVSANYFLNRLSSFCSKSW